jgi:sulfur-oxidizing protein SoxY
MKLALFAVLALLSLAPAARADDDDDDAAERAQRWNLVRMSVYGDRAVQDAGDAVQLNAPARAMDAALVPVTVRFETSRRIVALSLFVDNNPSPLVGVFHFGPAMTQGQIKTRVRVDAYTMIHAVAETDDGSLLVAAQFVKAAGGCSSPGTGQSAAVAAQIGQMQLRRVRPAEGTAIPAQLLISHPNYNGMQRSVGSAYLIPARYLETISVKTGGVTVFDLDSNISLSEDPSISFVYTPAGDGGVEVVAQDSTGATFERRFEPLAE